MCAPRGPLLTCGVQVVAFPLEACVRDLLHHELQVCWGPPRLLITLARERDLGALGVAQQPCMKGSRNDKERLAWVLESCGQTKWWQMQQQYRLLSYATTTQHRLKVSEYKALLLCFVGLLDV